MDHIREALLACNFPSWGLNSPQTKFNHNHNIQDTETTTRDQHNDYNNKGSNNQNISVMLPYAKGLGEKFKKSCNTLGIQVYFSGNNIIRTLLMAPKDTDNKYQTSGVIYRLKCLHINCTEEYKDESSRSFGERLKEHLRAPSLYMNTVTLQGIKSTQTASP